MTTSGSSGVTLTDSFRIQSRHPSGGKGGRECQTKRCARILGNQHAQLGQSRDNAAGMAVSSTHHTANFAAWEFTAIEDGFENASGLSRHLADPYFFFYPQKNTRAQAVRLDQALDESDLVNAGLEEKPGELSQGFFA